MKAVTWPTKKQLVKLTGLVVVSVIVLAVFFGVIDMGIGAAIKGLLSL